MTVGGVRGGRPSLVPYACRLEDFHATPASVSKTCLVRFDNNRYSEAETRAGRQGRMADYLPRMDFIILGGLGYLPLAQSGGRLLSS